jgi:hypothetical protein
MRYIKDKEPTMSVVYTELNLKNEGDIILAEEGFIKENEIRQLIVQAIADTGRWTIVINDETPIYCSAH